MDVPFVPTCRDITLSQGEQLHLQQCGDAECVCVCCQELRSHPITPQNRKDILRCHWEWHGSLRNNAMHERTVRFSVKTITNDLVTVDETKAALSRERIGVVFRSEPHRILGIFQNRWQMNSSWVSSSEEFHSSFSLRSLLKILATNRGKALLGQRRTKFSS